MRTQDGWFCRRRIERIGLYRALPPEARRVSGEFHELPVHVGLVGKAGVDGDHGHGFAVIKERREGALHADDTEESFGR